MPINALQGEDLQWWVFFLETSCSLPGLFLIVVFAAFA
jgi:hypothetical protein